MSALATPPGLSLLRPQPCGSWLCWGPGAPDTSPPLPPDTGPHSSVPAGLEKGRGGCAPFPTACLALQVCAFSSKSGTCRSAGAGMVLPAAVPWGDHCPPRAWQLRVVLGPHLLLRPSVGAHGAFLPLSKPLRLFSSRAPCGAQPWAGGSPVRSSAGARGPLSAQLRQGPAVTFFQLLPPTETFPSFLNKALTFQAWVSACPSLQQGRV